MDNDSKQSAYINILLALDNYESGAETLVCRMFIDYANGAIVPNTFKVVNIDVLKEYMAKGLELHNFVLDGVELECTRGQRKNYLASNIVRKCIKGETVLYFVSRCIPAAYYLSEGYEVLEYTVYDEISEAFNECEYSVRDLKVRRNEVSRYTDGNMILLRNNCEWERITSAYAVNIIKSELEFDTPLCNYVDNLFRKEGTEFTNRIENMVRSMEMSGLKATYDELFGTVYGMLGEYNFDVKNTVLNIIDSDKTVGIPLYGNALYRNNDTQIGSKDSEVDALALYFLEDIVIHTSEKYFDLRITDKKTFTYKGIHRTVVYFYFWDYNAHSYCKACAVIDNSTGTVDKFALCRYKNIYLGKRPLELVAGIYSTVKICYTHIRLSNGEIGDSYYIDLNCIEEEEERTKILSYKNYELASGRYYTRIYGSLSIGFNRDGKKMYAYTGDEIYDVKDMHTALKKTRLDYTVSIESSYITYSRMQDAIECVNMFKQEGLKYIDILDTDFEHGSVMVRKVGLNLNLICVLGGFEIEHKYTAVELSKKDVQSRYSKNLYVSGKYAILFGEYIVEVCDYSLKMICKVADMSDMLSIEEFKEGRLTERCLTDSAYNGMFDNIRSKYYALIKNMFKHVSTDKKNYTYKADSFEEYIIAINIRV